ncbi:hypothetical protein D7X12_24860 [Corallococcus sicarius]|uniref:Cys-rich protein n=2 Tax=Corallococcus sicarius TaxID=2316726 RepID=A0A3A8N3J3_9BACT|nr:hypothetical protein D7X12_24860 [Corallococcus sicarius]
MNGREKERTMMRFTRGALALGMGALLWATPGMGASKCERRCAEDKAKMEKVCKDTAKNAVAMCIQIAGQARDKCMKKCADPAAYKRERNKAKGGDSAGTHDAH